MANLTKPKLFRHHPINLSNSRGLVFLCTLLVGTSCTPQNTGFHSGSGCSYDALHSAKMFTCDASASLDLVKTGPANSYNNDRQFFPQTWHQFGANQQHNAVYDVPSTAPAYLQNGTFWAAPLTGLEYQYLRKAQVNFPNNGNQTWNSIVATTLGNIMGATVAQGIVFVQLSKQKIVALDAASGHEIWHKELVNVAGMGQTIAATVNGKLMIFVAVGDATFTLDNVLDFANGLPHDRGSAFSGLFAFDGVTGQLQWSFSTKGAARPAPVFRDGKLHLATSGGSLFILDAASGRQLGSFTNPGEGFPGLSSPNWFETADNRRFIIYGTVRPRRILAVDVTTASKPSLAWAISAPGADANSTGDTPMAVDVARGLVLTTVFTAVNGEFQLNLIALDALTGTTQWSALTGAGPRIPGFKASVPMVHENAVYFGNSLNQTYQSYDLDSGQLRWVTPLRDNQDAATTQRRPGGAAAFYNGKLIQSEGNKIRTLDPTTGAILNEFVAAPESFASWPITQTVIVGGQLYLTALSGWVYALPVAHVMSEPGVATRDSLNLALRKAESVNPLAIPFPMFTLQFPSEWLAYAGTPEHNSYLSRGPSGVRWDTKLDATHSLALRDAPRDEALHGTETATLMTHLAFGVGTGVTPANGYLYASSGRYAVNAINANNGRVVWRHHTTSANFGQPLVTRNTLVVSAGDHWMNLGNSGNFRNQSPNTVLGARFSHVMGLDLYSGTEKWSLYTAGTTAMTPLYYQGNLLFVNGQGQLWAVNADSGAPVAPYMNNGKPVLTLPGFNAISSANVYTPSNGPDIMVVGTAMPNSITGIDLQTGKVAWTQSFPGVATHLTGFSATSPAVSNAHGLIVGSVLVDADATANTSTMMAFALDASTGDVVWTQSIGSGAIPAGFAASSPVLDASHAYFHNPQSGAMLALDLSNGMTSWQSSVSVTGGKPSWAPGVLVGQKWIQPIGPDLVTFDKQTGVQLNRINVGGSFTYNHPTVIGKTLYIGNSWGWVHAYPLGTVTGDPSDS